MRALSALAGLALMAALAGCSDSDDGGKVGPTTELSVSVEPLGPPTSEAASSPAGGSEEAEVEAAYRTYTDAFLTGDGVTSYPLLSERCRKAVPLSDFAKFSEEAADTYGALEYTVESVKVAGDQARVSVKFPVAALQGDDPRGSLWVFEDGGWHSDKCGD